MVLRGGVPLAISNGVQECRAAPLPPPPPKPPPSPQPPLEPPSSTSGAATVTTSGPSDQLLPSPLPPPPHSPLEAKQCFSVKLIDEFNNMNKAPWQIRDAGNELIHTINLQEQAQPREVCVPAGCFMAKGVGEALSPEVDKNLVLIISDCGAACSQGPCHLAQ